MLHIINFVLQRFRKLLQPLPSWGPALLHHRQEAARVHQKHGTDFGGKVDYFEEKDIPTNFTMHEMTSENGTENKGYSNDIENGAI